MARVWLCGVFPHKRAARPLYPNIAEAGGAVPVDAAGLSYNAFYVMGAGFACWEQASARGIKSHYRILPRGAPRALRARRSGVTEFFRDFFLTRFLAETPFSVMIFSETFFVEILSGNSVFCDILLYSYL